MDIQTIGTAVGIASVVGLAVLYVIRAEQSKQVDRLDGRINTHEAECTQRQLKLDERHEAIQRTLEHISAQLDRMVR